MPDDLTASQAASDDAPKGPNASPQQQVDANGRVVVLPDTTSPTNADETETQENGGGDSGTDPETTTIQDSQATYYENDGTSSSSGAIPETYYENDGTASSSVPIEEGQGAADDDAANISRSTTQNNVNVGTNQLGVQITPKPNPLDRFYSYTYSASVYMLTATQYESLLRSKVKKVDGYYLLFQSGGAPLTTGVRPPPPSPAKVFENDGTASTVTPDTPSYPDGGRNPFFPNDYYIDSITLDTSPLGKATGASHMTASMKFNVVETQGITLIDNLYAAAQNLQQKDSSGIVNYTATEYLMVIRFYGYDENGKIVQVRGGLGDPEGTSDSKALIEKFIPFKVAAINWSVGSKLVTYEWDCVPQGQLMGGYTARGSIPYDVQLVDSTVEGLLGGNASYGNGKPPDSANPGQTTTTVSAAQAERDDAAAVDAAASAPPPKANQAPTDKKTITKGLMGALNDFQKDLVSRGIYKYPDRYFIKFIGNNTVPANAISGARLTPKAKKIDKQQVASGTNDPKNLKPESNAVDMVSRSFSITAGQMVTQAIELAIRNSSYITDQALVIMNPDGTTYPNPNARNKPMQWFTIIMSAKPNSPMDPLRNDYAYDITYTIAPYLPGNFNSKYFPASKFNGVHKSYPYWFTGQNTAVLEYQETLNALYSITVSGNDPKNSAAAVQRANFTSSMRDIPKFNYDPRSSQSSQGAEGKTNELPANAAENLFSPGDLASVKVKIIGDPDWIQQGSLFREVTPGTYAVSASKGFGPDGSIAFDSGDVLFEVAWQRPEDYDLSTGIADPYSRTSKKYGNREPIQSRVYIATKIISEFRQGRFEQTIEGTIFMFPVPKGTNAINAAAATSENATGAQDRATAAATKKTQPNVTAGTAARTGVDLSAAAAQQARQDFAKSDPRLLTNSDGGKAAILGAQGAYNNVGFANNGGGAAFGNPNLVRQGITAGTSVLPAGPSEPPTSNGESVSTGNNNAPRKLGGSSNPNSSTDPSQQNIAKENG